MKLKAKFVNVDCDWIKLGKIYSATETSTEDMVTIIDEKGVETVCWIGEAEYLNEYVKWEII